MRIVCCVSHLDAPGIWACLGTVAALQGPAPDRVRVVIGKQSPAASLDASLALAREAGVDLLLHMRSDVLLTPQALERLLAAQDPGRIALVLGRCYDPLVDRIAPGHVQLFDLRRLGAGFRFADHGPDHGPDLAGFASRADARIAARVLAGTGTGAEVVASAGDEAVAYWHPVWSARDLYLQFATVTDTDRLARMTAFLQRGLTLDPENRALQAAQAALQAGTGRDRAAAARAFEDHAADQGLDGTEYHIRHKFYASLGKSILDSAVQCVCDRPEPHVPLIHWR